MNKRRKNHKDLEVVQEGFANGVAPGFPLSEKEKQKMINKAAKAYAHPYYFHKFYLQHYELPRLVVLELLLFFQTILLFYLT